MNRVASNHDMALRGWITGGLVMLVVAWGPTPAAAERITIRSQAVPPGTVVRLGDVADIRTEDSRRAQALAALPLMPAPAPGTLRYLRMREIQDLLAAHGEDLHRLQFNGQTIVEVHSPDLAGKASAEPAARPSDSRAGARPVPLSEREISKLNDRLRDLIVGRLQSLSGHNEPWQVTFEASERHLQLLRAATSPPVCEGGVEPWTGTQRFLISLATADGSVRFPVHAEVTLPRQIGVAVRPIPRGAIITAADVEMQYIEDVPRATVRRAPIETLNQLIGMEAARPIQVGDVIFTGQVSAPLFVHRGEVVTVVARGGGIRVRTHARAREDGAQGDLVQVESLETRERYDAQVTGPRELTVFAGVPARSGTSTAQRPPAAWR